MKKNENIVITIISVLLIAGIVMGVFALFKRIDETLSDIDETESSTETVAPESEGSGSETEADTEVDVADPNLYINESTGTGYHIVDGKTYFFCVYEYSSTGSNDLTFNDASFKTFADYSPSFYYAIVNDSTSGITWKTQTLSSNAEGGANSLSLTSVNHTIYITYTVISNCSNPAYVLADLNQNVFFDTAYYHVYRTTVAG